MKAISALAVAALAAAGCSTRLIDFTVISTKNVDLSRGASFERAKERVEGIDKVHIIVFIPTGTPNMKEAIDRAIESVPGAVALLDGVVTQTFWWIPYIYGQSMFLVEGTPLVDPTLKVSADLPSYFFVRTYRDGSTSVRKLTSASYERLRRRHFSD